MVRRRGKRRIRVPFVSLLVGVKYRRYSVRLLFVNELLRLEISDGITWVNVDRYKAWLVLMDGRGCACFILEGRIKNFLVDHILVYDRNIYSGRHFRFIGGHSWFAYLG